LGDAERTQGGRQLADAVAPQLVRGIDSQPTVSVADDLTLFAECAGNDMDVGATRDVMGNRATGCQRFIVWMGVHEQQTRRFL
jgi:hypothetical protein